MTNAPECTVLERPSPLIEARTPHEIDALLVPVDESPAAERAVPVALALAARLRVPIDLLSVADDASSGAVLRDHLERLAHAAGTAVRHADVVPGPHVATELVHRLASRPDAAVVLASQGPTRVAGLLADSVTADLLAAGRDVLVVGPHAQLHPTSLPVVACVDGSIESLAALDAASRWAAALDVELAIVMVTSPPIERGPAALTQVTVDGRAVLRELILEAQARRPSLDVHGTVVRWPWGVADALSMYLERHPAQLFVVAAHLRPGHLRSGLHRLLHPGTTARVVHQLRAPVLVVPADDGRDPIATDDHLVDELLVPVPAGDLRVDPAIAVAHLLAARLGATMTLAQIGPVAATPEHAARCDELAALLAPVPCRWEELPGGDVAQVLIERGARGEHTVVCAAVAPRGKLWDALSSSGPGRLVRWAPRPIVLVGPSGSPPEGGFHEVVAAVDGSLVSDAVVDLAAGWARALRLPLRVLHVADPAAMIAGGMLAEQFVDRLAARAARRHGIAATAAVVHRESPPAAIVDDLATTRDALVVVGCHGAGISRHPLGSVVLDVVRNAPVPVVVLPAHPVRPPREVTPT